MRMPNSRVRPLTENASTPATPTTEIKQRHGRKPAEYDRIQPIRRQHFRAKLQAGSPAPPAGPCDI